MLIQFRICIFLLYTSDEMRKRYHIPEHTSYESCYLTYQPMPVRVENEMLGTIRQHAKWFANGAATKKIDVYKRQQLHVILRTVNLFFMNYIREVLMIFPS